jgi:hypothetical protein
VCVCVCVCVRVYKRACAWIDMCVLVLVRMRACVPNISDSQRDI